MKTKIKKNGLFLINSNNNKKIIFLIKLYLAYLKEKEVEKMS
jgi:hypothetical protein